MLALLVRRSGFAPGLTGLCLAAVTAASASPAARPVEGPAGEFGGAPEDWAGGWTVFEPSAGRLDVELLPAGGDLPEHLKIGVSSTGESEAGSAQNSAGLSRALNPDRSMPGDGVETLRFQFWVDDLERFLARGASFGFSSTDAADVSALSSRSTWNLICYGAKTALGGESLRAGELAIRAVRPADGVLATIPTGIILESGLPVQVTLQIHAVNAVFGIRIVQGGQVFEKSGLGFWAKNGNAGKCFINAFFSAPSSRGFSVCTGAWSLRKEP